MHCAPAGYVAGSKEKNPANEPKHMRLVPTKVADCNGEKYYGITAVARTFVQPFRILYSGRLDFALDMRLPKTGLRPLTRVERNGPRLQSTGWWRSRGDVSFWHEADMQGPAITSAFAGRADIKIEEHQVCL